MLLMCLIQVLEKSTKFCEKYFYRQFWENYVLYWYFGTITSTLTILKNCIIDLWK